MWLSHILHSFFTYLLYSVFLDFFDDVFLRFNLFLEFFDFIVFLLDYLLVILREWPSILVRYVLLLWFEYPHAANENQNAINYVIWMFDDVFIALIDFGSEILDFPLYLIKLRFTLINIRLIRKQCLNYFSLNLTWRNIIIFSIVLIFRIFSQLFTFGEHILYFIFILYIFWFDIG